MQKYSSGNGYFVIVKRGEEVVGALNTFANEQKLKTAWVSGIGGASKVTLGFYNLENKEYQWRTFEEPLEIVGVQGNLSIVGGQPFWHLHGTFSNQNYEALGGHVKGLVVGLTCELFISPTPIGLTRKHDNETGLKLLSDS
jgi:predicted DNA-binding protein with PD1-like motif